MDKKMFVFILVVTFSLLVAIFMTYNVNYFMSKREKYGTSGYDLLNKRIKMFVGSFTTTFFGTYLVILEFFKEYIE
jgi:hypothetical protein